MDTRHIATDLDMMQRLISHVHMDCAHLAEGAAAVIADIEAGNLDLAVHHAEAIRRLANHLGAFTRTRAAEPIVADPAKLDVAKLAAPSRLLRVLTRDGEEQS